VLYSVNPGAAIQLPPLAPALNFRVAFNIKLGKIEGFIGRKQNLALHARCFSPSRCAQCIKKKFILYES